MDFVGRRGNQEGLEIGVFDTGDDRDLFGPENKQGLHQFLAAGPAQAIGPEVHNHGPDTLIQRGPPDGMHDPDKSGPLRDPDQGIRGPARFGHLPAHTDLETGRTLPGQRTGPVVARNKRNAISCCIGTLFPMKTGQKATQTQSDSQTNPVFLVLIAPLRLEPEPFQGCADKTGSCFRCVTIREDPHPWLKSEPCRLRTNAQSEAVSREVTPASVPGENNRIDTELGQDLPPEGPGQPDVEPRVGPVPTGEKPEREPGPESVIQCQSAGKPPSRYVLIPEEIESEPAP